MKILQWRGRTGKKAFATRFQAALQEHLPDATISACGELELRVVRSPQADTETVWLDRAYREFCKAPANIEEIVSRWVRGIAAIGSDAIEPDRIIPVIKDHRWLASQGTLSSGPPELALWTEPYNSELVVVFAQFRDSLNFCNRSRFEALGIPLHELRERAFVNLRNIINNVSVTGEAGEYLLGAGGTIDSSLLLLERIVEDPRIELEGEPLVGISDRDSFWVADGANPYAVFGIAARVARYYRSEAYPISQQLFHKRAARWEPLDPNSEDQDHPIPNVTVIDFVGARHDGGTDLAIVVASPLGADARSVFRLLRKLDGYLEEINSQAWQQEHGKATPESTSIVVTLHPDSDPVIPELLHAHADWMKGRGALLVVEKL